MKVTGWFKGISAAISNSAVALRLENNFIFRSHLMFVTELEYDARFPWHLYCVEL